MTIRKPGLDHNIYSHWPFPARQPWPLPGQAHLAVCIYLYLEKFEAEPLEDMVFDRRYRGSLANHPPYNRAQSFFEYGNRVGIFRVLELLDRYGIRASVAANSSACLSYPFLIEQFGARGYEFLAHGFSASRMISSRMPVDMQRNEIQSARDIVTQTTGIRPLGWMSQDYGQSTASPALIAEAGFAYIADYGNDDQPYSIKTAPPMVSIPNQSEWDDVQMMVHRKIPGKIFSETAIEAFNQLHAEGATTGRFFGLHIHPWITGQPHRIGYLENILNHLAQNERIWQATAGEIVAQAQSWLDGQLVADNA